MPLTWILLTVGYRSSGTSFFTAHIDVVWLIKLEDEQTVLTVPVFKYNITELRLLAG